MPVWRACTMVRNRKMATLATRSAWVVAIVVFKLYGPAASIAPTMTPTISRRRKILLSWVISKMGWLAGRKSDSSVLGSRKKQSDWVVLESLGITQLRLTDPRLGCTLNREAKSNQHWKECSLQWPIQAPGRWSPNFQVLPVLQLMLK